MKENKVRTVELVKSNYQPKNAELEEDLRFDGTFEELTNAMVTPVKIRWIDKPRKRRKK